MIAPANTGRESNSNTAVIKTDHTNKGICSIFMCGLRMLRIVEIKLIAPKIEEIPAKCREKIVRSTAGPLWAKYEDRGGYTVHPVPAPCSDRDLLKINKKDGGNSQNLKLFIRGKAMSGAPIIRGTNQLPNPPIKIGITKKKIITKAWLVTVTLYSCSSEKKLPGCANSIRIIILKDVPIVAAHRPNMKYSVPISLWFVEKIHRRKMAELGIKL